MEKTYEYRSEGFLVKQDESKCEYTVKHAKWAEPVMTIYIKPDQNPNVSRWAGRAPRSASEHTALFKEHLTDVVSTSLVQTAKAQQLRNAAKRERMSSTACECLCAVSKPRG